MADVWPTELRVKNAGRDLAIAFDDGTSYELSAEMLRVMSPSAEVQGHSPAERRTVGGKREVAIVAAQAVGNYAVKLAFDDGHQTGIYTWDYLAELGRDRDAKWAAYLEELAAKGLTRERAGEALATADHGCGGGGCGCH